MPSPSDFGFWVPDQTQDQPQDQIRSKRSWPGGDFDSLDEWEVVPIQVYQAGGSYPGHNGFTTAAFGNTTNPLPLGPIVSNTIGGKYIPTFVPKSAGSVEVSDVGKLRGKVSTTDPAVWVLDNPVPFSGKISDNVVSIVPNLYIPYYKADQTWGVYDDSDIPTTSKSLILSSTVDLEYIVKPLATIVTRGPYVISKKSVNLTKGQVIEFWWRANARYGTSFAGFALSMYLLNVGPDAPPSVVNNVNLPTYRQIILDVAGVRPRESDHALKVQQLLKADTRKNVALDRKIFEAEHAASRRPLSEVEFARGRTVVESTGLYRLVIVHSTWGNRQGGATTEIAGIRIL
jgi:hypothetical protein